MFTFFTYQVLLNMLQFHQLRVLSQLCSRCNVFSFLYKVLMHRSKWHNKNCNTSQYCILSATAEDFK